MNRFMTATKNSNAGLPVRFWEMIDPADFDVFCETGVVSPSISDAIRQYAHESQAGSVKRLETLQSHFDTVLVVEV